MTPARVEAGGVELAYEDHGEGGSVVFVHGTATARSVWRETIAALDESGHGARAIAYDRRAYGDSGAPEPYGGTTVGEQADDLAELIGRVDAAPALLVGHELGALAALDVLVRHPERAAGAVLIEPPMLWLAAAGTDAVGDLREAVASAARESGAGGAVRAYLEEVGGEGALDLLGSERAEAALSQPRAFAADLAAAASWTAGRRELRAIDAPITLVSGTRAAPVRQEAVRALGELLPDARLVQLDCGFFAHLERPRDLAAAIVAGV